MSVGTFATQAETIELHYPELSIARTAVLDYFQSPEQKRLAKIFTWEENYDLKPGEHLIKYLRNVCRELGIADPNHHLFINDDYATRFTALIRSYPELKAYRDIAFWWKHFLNTDRKVFLNYSDPESPTDISRQLRVSAQLRFEWDDDANEYRIRAFRKRESLRCKPKLVKGQPFPIHRFPSTATPSFYLPPPAVRTEDDVIYRANLPNFANAYGQVLNQRDSELLLSYLTVPYLRLPLLLTFFSSDDRIHKLQSIELRMILDSVLFEPGKYLRLDMSGVEPVMVPTRHPELLATPYGLLINELYRSPDTIIRCILNLLRGALAVDTGAVVDEAGLTFNVSTSIIMYMCRTGSRIDNYISFLIDWRTGKHDCVDAPLRDVVITEEVLDKLTEGRAKIREVLHVNFHKLFTEYLERLGAEIAKDPTNEKLISRNSRLACDLHSHKLIMYRNMHDSDITPKVVSTVLSSFVYLTTRHTWNKATMKEIERLQMPETEIYELLQVMRRRLVRWCWSASQGNLDYVMQTAMEVSSTLTGSIGDENLIDQQNRWSRIKGLRSVGRWAVGSTRTVTVAKSGPLLVEEPNAVNSPRLRADSSDGIVGEVLDDGQLGVEIDLQMGQMTLRSKHLSALPSAVANHRDVKLLFGETTIQASRLESAENRDRYRLVGLNHEVEYWKAHKSCPSLGDEWEREYDPGDLFPSEKWIVNLFEPVRKSFFDGPNPKPMQFMLPPTPTPEDAEVAVLLGLHQVLGGPFKLLFIFRRLRCIHVYECVSHARQWWFTLHMTTDTRYTMREMQPDTRPRKVQHPHWWIRGAGAPYPQSVQECLMNDLEDGVSEPQNSVLIIREAQHFENLSGGREVLIPSRLLYGTLPQALLDAYRFWQDESICPRDMIDSGGAQAVHGYKRLLGYPVCSEGEYLLIVEMQCVGSFAELSATTRTCNPFLIQCTQMPGRTVRVVRTSKKAFEAGFKQRQRIAALLESVKLLVPPAPKAVVEEEDDTCEPDALFAVGTEVECDYEGKGEFWPCIVQRVNDNGSYDLEFTDDHKWLGVRRGVETDTVQKRGDAKKKDEGEGVWHWAGMTDSEEDDWRESSDEDKEPKGQDNTKSSRLTYAQFCELGRVLNAANGNEELCERCIRKLASIPGPLPFSDVNKLSKAIAEECSRLETQDLRSNVKEDSYGVKDMYLLNLLYAPRRSRLCSAMKVLSRIENVSHMCAWTYVRPQVSSDTSRVDDT